MTPVSLLMGTHSVFSIVTPACGRSTFLKANTRGSLLIKRSALRDLIVLITLFGFSSAFPVEVTQPGRRSGNYNKLGTNGRAASTRMTRYTTRNAFIRAGRVGGATAWPPPNAKSVIFEAINKENPNTQ